MDFCREVRYNDFRPYKDFSLSSIKKLYVAQATYSFQMLLNNFKNSACCVSVNAAQQSSNSFWSADRDIVSSSSAKNWERVIPNPQHTFSNVCIVGSCCFRYHVEIVDCDKPECCANSYSDQFRFNRNLVISASISFKISPRYFAIPFIILCQSLAIELVIKYNKYGTT